MKVLGTNYSNCLKIFYCCDKTLCQSKLGRKGLIWLTVPHHERKSGQELKQGKNQAAGIDAEAVEECCLLACSSWLAQPAFLCYPGHSAKKWHHSVWGYPSHINHQSRHYSTDLPTGQPYESFFSRVVLSLQVTLAWIKLM